jgi:predicted dithiol-disulfide oxidoreductase (DUF899 family)
MCTSYWGRSTFQREISNSALLWQDRSSPIARQLLTRERGWRNLKFYQCIGTSSLKRTEGLLLTAASGLPSTFGSGEEKVHHFWGGESSGTQDPGQDPHGAPDIAPLWNILDLTPGGRGTDWYPKLTY